MFVKLSLQVRTHLAPHLVDYAECEHRSSPHGPVLSQTTLLANMNTAVVRGTARGEKASPATGKTHCSEYYRIFDSGSCFNMSLTDIRGMPVFNVIFTVLVSPQHIKDYTMLPRRLGACTDLPAQEEQHGVLA